MKKSIYVCIKIIAISIVTLVGFGCASINPKPFAGFAESIQSLRQGADAALAIQDEENRVRFIDETVEDMGNPEYAEDAVQNLLIEGKLFEWKMNRKPLYMTSKRFRSGVFSLNSALFIYSGLLKELASEELVDRQKFDKLAKDLNANLMSAAKALDISDAKRDIALFSVVASAAAHAYIESRRQKHLLEAIINNQKQMEILSAGLQEAVRISVRNLRQNYEERSKKLADEFSMNPNMSESKRRSLVETLVKLNEEFITRLAVMESLHNAYGTLTSAHNELSEAIKKPELSLSYIAELYEQGRHLHKLYKELGGE
ncbi:hypothetical protein ACFL2O_09705 [Thermodesulfobacteriota bacterium]